MNTTIASAGVALYRSTEYDISNEHTTPWYENCTPSRVGEYECTFCVKHPKPTFITRRYWDGECWSRSYMHHHTKEAIDSAIAKAELAVLQTCVIWRGLREQFQ